MNLFYQCKIIISYVKNIPNYTLVAFWYYYFPSSFSLLLHCPTVPHQHSKTYGTELSGSSHINASAKTQANSTLWCTLQAPNNAPHTAVSGSQGMLLIKSMASSSCPCQPTMYTSVAQCSTRGSIPYSLDIDLNCFQPSSTNPALALAFRTEINVIYVGCTLSLLINLKSSRASSKKPWAA